MIYYRDIFISEIRSSCIRGERNIIFNVFQFCGMKLVRDEFDFYVNNEIIFVR